MFVYITASKVNKFRYIELSTKFLTILISGKPSEIIGKFYAKRDKKRVKSTIIYIICQ